MTRPTTTPAAARRRRTVTARMPRGFTLVELLVVIVILAVLAALLLPAINAAVRTAKNAAVSAEINQLAQALEQFKSKFGAYPPSRVLLVENGNYSTYLNSNASMSSIDSSSPGTGDITVGQLATRTLTAFRQIWPRVQLSTNGSSPPNLNTNFYYDFNGNGTLDGAYILHGHECLVFFLGGVPIYDPATQGFGMTGWGKDPTNPFSNNIVGNSMYNANRETPYFEFNAGRLFADPTNPTTPHIPGYYDTLGSQPPLSATGTEPTNFYAYFNAYGNGNYDPNDVNFHETDNLGSSLPIELQYTVGFYTFGSTFNALYGRLALAQSLHQHADGRDRERDHHLPEAAVVPDHLLGDRRDVRRRRPVPVGHDIGVSPVAVGRQSYGQHVRRLHPSARVRQREQFQVGDTLLSP